MSEGNKVIVRRYFEGILDGGDLDLVNEIFDPQYVLHDPNSSQEVRGLEGSRQFVGVFRSAFPDIAHTIEDQIAEGDKVVTRLRARATHKGELMGILPTGKEVTIRGSASGASLTARSGSAGSTTTPWA